MSNDDLEPYVSAEIHWDPKIDDSAIAVSADDGLVTLRPVVGRFSEKPCAKKDAQRVSGVTSVKNELEGADPHQAQSRRRRRSRGPVARAHPEQHRSVDHRRQGRRRPSHCVNT